MTTEIKQQATKDKTATEQSNGTKPRVMAVTDGKPVVVTHVSKEGMETSGYGVAEVQRLGNGRMLTVILPDGSSVRILAL